jgi:phosphatidylethanolamine/phosphatidyl-N-methylethanolamine N-methyltransferase
MEQNDLSPKAWYSSGYKNCYYTGLLGKAYGLVHRKMELPFGKDASFPVVLEVGAGNGEHLAFVKHQFDRYVMTDIESIDLLGENENAGIETMKLDCQYLTPFENGSVDRLIATCLLVHLNDMKGCLIEWRRVIRTGGIITIYVAPEPGILLMLLRRLFIWPKARKNGLQNPELFAFQEHKNHYPAMRSIIREVFSKDKISKSRFPFTFLPWNFCFFEIVQIEIR